jgi:hypothetical protein
VPRLDDAVRLPCLVGGARIITRAGRKRPRTARRPAQPGNLPSVQPERHYGRTAAAPDLRVRSRAVSATGALAIVVLAAFCARVALNWGLSTPWIAPDEMLYALLGESMWGGGMEVLGEPSRYYGIYPLLPGGLFRLFGPDHARLATLLVQTAIGCSTAIVTYLWARHVASARWSVGVACAVLLLPALDYSGLMLTESVSLLAVTTALYLLWRAFAHPSWLNQVLAFGAIVLASQVRLQAVLLVPATILAVALFCLAARRFQPIRDQALLLVGLVVSLGAWLLAGALRGSVLGGYSPVADTPVPVGQALEWTVWHLGALAVMTALVPLAGAAAIFLLTFLGRVNETGVRALVAITLAWAAVALVTAGGFVAQNVDHLKERNLSTLVPPILVCFAAWGTRRLWSFRGTTVACACVAGLMVAVLPDRVFASAGSTFDAPSLLALHLVSEHISGLGFRAALVAAITVCLLGSWWIARSTWARRAWLPGLLVLPLALLTVMSLVASREIRIAADGDRQFFLGSGAPDWIDRRTESPTLLVDDGSFYWNDYWHQAYWNRRVTGVLALSQAQGGPLPGRVDARVDGDGWVRNGVGQPVRSPMLVTSNAISVAGSPRARAARRDGTSRLVLWDAEQPLRLRYRIRGTELGRTSDGPFQIEVFDCDRNALRVLLRGSAPTVVRYTGGGVPLEARVDASPRWTPIVVPLTRASGAVSCVARFEPASVVSIGSIAQINA